ncbi:MAG: alpha-galactosidase [Verrucomicrobia bacterium]|nr:alpha-galactosidase [Verrucomicrobiota bacterium]
MRLASRSPALLWFGLLTWAAALSAPASDPAPAAADLAHAWAALPSLPTQEAELPPSDWLVRPGSVAAGVFRTAETNEIALANGLIRRTFRVAPNGATVGLDNLMTGASLLRGVKPEALLTVDGTEHSVGGLVGQPNYAYLLPEWLARLEEDPKSFALERFAVGRPQAPLVWRRKRPSQDLPWPPPGATLECEYAGRADGVRGLTIRLHYELYDGLPVLGKWLSVSNGSPRAVTIDRLATEVLALVEAESAVDTRPTNKWRLPPISVMSDYSFGGMDPVTASRVTEWLIDPEFKTQVHYARQTPCLLVCRPPLGPGVRLEPGQTLDSFRVWLVVHDSDTRERQGLALRRAQRALAPWLTENPLMMHVRSADTPTFRRAVDQCAAVGFEMIIYTFGSGLNMENLDPAYVARIKADVDYAHARGIEVGAYSLFSSRRIDDANDVIHPQSGKPGGAIFGHAPCLGSRWGQEYLRTIRTFLEQTGLDLLEHDGPYPGDVCASTLHPGHLGLADSQWTQWRASAAFYGWCRSRGIYVNAPDYYFFTGSNKTGMGYREDNWSLPRAQQILHGRQNIYDGTWEKTPTMGWMFVPLTEYHGGGAAATLEPLSAHLADYEAHLANNLGAGVQACYRGPRLYDTEATRALVQRWVSWFKQYRDILESDLIHLRRADGRDLDYFLHVNPQLARCGLAMIYNPLGVEVHRTLTLPLYYTGLTEWASIREQEEPPQRYRLDREFRVRVPVRVPPNSRTWLVIEQP